MLKSLAGGQVSDRVARGGDGQVVRVVSTPLENGGWVATHEDITEHQQLLDGRQYAEQAAQRTEAQT